MKWIAEPVGDDSQTCPCFVFACPLWICPIDICFADFCLIKGCFIAVEVL